MPSHRAHAYSEIAHYSRDRLIFQVPHDLMPVADGIGVVHWEIDEWREPVLGSPDHYRARDLVQVKVGETAGLLARVNADSIIRALEQDAVEWHERLSRCLLAVTGRGEFALAAAGHAASASSATGRSHHLAGV